MAIGACERCSRFYVLDSKLFRETLCPHCGQPLRPSTTRELKSHRDRSDPLPPAEPPTPAPDEPQGCS
jgi:hypothetical protein